MARVPFTRGCGDRAPSDDSRCRAIAPSHELPDSSTSCRCEGCRLSRQALICLAAVAETFTSARPCSGVIRLARGRLDRWRPRRRRSERDLVDTRMSPRSWTPRSAASVTGCRSPRSAIVDVRHAERRRRRIRAVRRKRRGHLVHRATVSSTARSLPLTCATQVVSCPWRSGWRRRGCRPALPRHFARRAASISWRRRRRTRSRTSRRTPAARVQKMDLGRARLDEALALAGPIGSGRPRASTTTVEYTAHRTRFGRPSAISRTTRLAELKTEAASPPVPSTIASRSSGELDWSLRTIPRSRPRTLWAAPR